MNEFVDTLAIYSANVVDIATFLTRLGTERHNFIYGH